MDNSYYTSDSEKRKKGLHLTLADRGAIQVLKRAGWSIRAIARELNCSPTTVSNELKRGTPKRRFPRGRIPGYSAHYGQGVYRQNRKRCHRRYRACLCQDFVSWVVMKVKERRWSFDMCVGYARKNKLFPREKTVCTKTLYNALRQRQISLTAFDLPTILKRKRHSSKFRENKRAFGKSIDERPQIMPDEFGHWEGDTVIRRKRKDDAAVFTLVEKLTRNYISIKIPAKSTQGVEHAMRCLQEEYGERFNQVFKSITVDNGSEFADFSSYEKYGTQIYFAHPYSSWERGQNERGNGSFREFVPKGHSINEYTSDQILQFADELNARPRRILEYATAEQLFDSYLDKIYAL